LDELAARLTEYEPWVWGTDDEVAVALKYKAMREQRSLKSKCPGTPHRGHTGRETPCPLDVVK